MQLRTSFAWLKVAARLRRQCVDLAAELGITLKEIALLGCLAENGPMYHNDLAIRAGIDKARLVRLASELSSAGLVRVDYDLPDRRRTELRLTCYGEELLESFESRLDPFEQNFFESLSDAERQLVDKLVARLLVNTADPPPKKRPRS